MHDTARQQTSHSAPVISEDSSLIGHLLQIHPVELGYGLITFTDEPFIVGRDPKSNLMIGENAVSRQHAKLEKTLSGFSITDLESTNGTWINGTKIESQQLQSSDRIRIGGRVFKYIAADQLEANYHEAVYTMMTKDSLTQAWNKRYLIETLQRELKRRKRTGNDLSLIILDLDFFKNINDTYGHLVGDELLRQIVDRLKSVLREEDILARFGGEEFCVVLTETSSENARTCASRCLDVISEKPFSTAAGDIECSISIGIGQATDSITCDELIKQADDNLYQAKKQGRNRFHG